MLNRNTSCPTFIAALLPLFQFMKKSEKINAPLPVCIKFYTQPPLFLVVISPMPPPPLWFPNPPPPFQIIIAPSLSKVVAFKGLILYFFKILFPSTLITFYLRKLFATITLSLTLCIHVVEIQRHDIIRQNSEGRNFGLLLEDKYSLPLFPGRRANKPYGKRVQQSLLLHRWMESTSGL